MAATQLSPAPTELAAATGGGSTAMTPDLLASTHHSSVSQSGGTLHSAASQLSMHDEPIADLFPECTVMFADISGFTAWSSVREPAQVFKLLETLYSSFDKIAKKRGVFKVVTIGDCYVSTRTMLFT